MEATDDGTAYLAKAVSYLCKIFIELITDKEYQDHHG
jgi:hypothetical protein